MKLTRERKIFASVLGLAAVAFAVDRVTGGGGTATDASDSSPAAVASEPSDLLMANATTPATGDKGAHGAVALNAASLSARISACAATTAHSNSPSRDLFRLPAKWSNQIQSNSADAARIAADKFSRSHRLSAVARNAGGGSVAVVEGKLLHVGNALDGFTLTSVAPDSAVFTGPGGTQVCLPLNAAEAGR